MERLAVLDREHFDAYFYLVGDTGGSAMKDEAEIRDEFERLIGIGQHLEDIAASGETGNPLQLMVVLRTLEPMQAVTATLRWVLEIERSDGSKADLRGVVDEWEQLVRGSA